MGRAENLRVVDPVLTELARGYSNESFISEAIFPLAPVEKEAGKIPQFSKAAFKIRETERAMGADPKRIQPEGRGTIAFQLEEHCIEYPLDKREQQESMFDEESHATDVANETIQLRREKMAADLVQDVANYQVGMKIELSGESKISDYTNSDPLGLVEDAKAAVRAKIGREPNTAVMGYRAFRDLKFHPQLLSKIQGVMKGILSLELLKELLEIENIVVGKGLYEAESGEFADLWQDNIILTYVPTAARKSIYQPSFGYTLRKKGSIAVTKYETENGKNIIVQSTDIFQVKIVGPEAAYLIKGTH